MWDCFEFNALYNSLGIHLKIDSIKQKCVAQKSDSLNDRIRGRSETYS